MASSRTIPKFVAFNDNPSQCSAWLKDKDRCCQRKIAAVEKTRKNLLLQSVSENPIYGTDEANELIGLYFCNGWHRPGGKYPISSLDRHKVFQILFPNTPEPAAWSTLAHQQQNPLFHSFANAAQGSAPINLSGEETLPFPNAGLGVPRRQSGQEPRTHAQVPTPTRQSTRLQGQEPGIPAQLPIPTRQSTRLQGQEPGIPAQLPIPTRQSARLRGQEPGTPAQLPIPTRQSARLRGQEPGIPAQLPIPTRQSARLRGQEPGIPAQLPIPTRQSTRLQGQEPGIPAQLPIPTRQSTRLQGQEPGIPAQLPIPTRQSARLRGQEPGTPAQLPIPTHQSARLLAEQLPRPTGQLLQPQPARRFANAPRNRVDPRKYRIVDVHADCPICMDPLENPNHVARCNSCYADYHGSCVAEWLVSTNITKHCGSCRAEVSHDEVKGVIEIVGNIEDRERLMNVISPVEA